MKLLSTLTAVCTCLTAYTSVAVAAETAADTATEAADPSVSGMLPAAEKTDAEPAADKDVSSSSDGAPKGREAKNAIYLDLAGPGLIYSLNYDREIIPDLSARIGISYLSMGASASDGSGNTTASAEFSYLAIPITASYLVIGSENNMFEVGGGPVIMNFSGSGLIESDDEDVSAGGSVTTVALTGLAGYRHQPADGGFVFRIGLSPMMTFGAGFLPWGYLSLGAAF
jgi:hypothetical protein